MPPRDPSSTGDKPADTRTKKTVVCKTCGRRIRVPEGWTVGPAVRRHYWAKHREVMTSRAAR